MKGIIFDIQRNSFVDGPGIRTTVFFKGCNLRCKWCHNPESHSIQKQMMYYQDKCIGCGKCAEVCPHQLKTCNFCGKCELYCPANARKICGKEYSVDDVFNEIVKDIFSRPPDMTAGNPYRIYGMVIPDVTPTYSS